MKPIGRAQMAEFGELLRDPWWRLTEGHLYKIISKNAKVIPFIPNVAQLQFLRSMHTRNVVPKARQRGLSTVIQLLMLDSALFTANFKGKVVAQDEVAATEIFRDKFKFAYNNLPGFIRKQMPLQTDSKTEILLPNGSSVSVTTSARSGTVQMLHVSEMGKIAAKWPEKAREIVTGSIPAVPPDGMIFIESTAEGREGEFYRMVMQAKKLRDSGVRLTPLDMKLHFYSWWDADEYQVDPHGVVITENDNAYFNRVEREIGVEIPAARRAWYCKTREGFGGDQEKMFQEMPSTVDEPFQVSTEGTYYAEQFVRARRDGRIARVPHDPTLPVYTAWDIGANDETAIWCIQVERNAFNVIDYFEGSGEPFAYFVNRLKDTGYTWAQHLLPHDAEHKRQQGMSNRSARDMIQELAPGWSLVTVPRIPETIHGIQQARDLFPRCWFDEVKCKGGLTHLELYRKEWDKQRSCWKDMPRHDVHSNGADAFRQFAQAIANGQITTAQHGATMLPVNRQRSWRG